MATREEIIRAVEEGREQVESTFRGLSDEQLDTQIYEDEGGWTARDILAHLAGRAQTYDMIYQFASSGEAIDPASFNVNAGNQALVDARRDRTPEELLDEFHLTHANLVERVQETDDVLLAKPVRLPGRELPAGDLLMNSGGRHSMAHAADVAEALERE